MTRCFPEAYAAYYRERQQEPVPVPEAQAFPAAVAASRIRTPKAEERMLDSVERPKLQPQSQTPARLSEQWQVFS
jgi:hypothetical protein